MADISAAPTTIRSLDPARPGGPRLGIAASLAAVFGLLGDAVKLAYVDPYSGPRRPQVAPDDDLKGRDPSW